MSQHTKESAELSILRQVADGRVWPESPGSKDNAVRILFRESRIRLLVHGYITRVGYRKYEMTEKGWERLDAAGSGSTDDARGGESCQTQ